MAVVHRRGLSDDPRSDPRIFPEPRRGVRTELPIGGVTIQAYAGRVSCAAPQATFKVVAHVRLNVNDVSRSVKWYREVLGFEETRHFGELAILPHADAEFELVLRPRRTVEHASHQETFDHVAFRVASVADLQAWEAHLRAIGLDVRIAHAIGGMSIDLLDPDGNDLELFVATPQS
jgi:glyoxylase I family protein